MSRFEYPLYAKFFYRYAVIPLSIILLVYLIMMIFGAGEHPVYIALIIIDALILYGANYQYYKSYKLLPFVIETGDEKLTASNFMPGVKKAEIKYSDIDDISGGVFGYNPKGLIFVHDGVQNRTIALHPSMTDINTLLRIIISKLDKDLRGVLLTRLNRQEEESKV